MTTELRDVVKAYLDEMYYNNKAFRAFCRKPTRDMWDKVKSDANHIVASGSTKGVIVFGDDDFVIKVPFLHEFDEYVDYCQVEWANYIAAKRDGIGDLFAAMDYFGTFHQLPVYVQEFVDCDEEAIEDEIIDDMYQYFLEVEAHNHEDLSEEELRDYFYDHWFDGVSSDDVAEYCEYHWGRKMYQQYDSFCEENGINDVHSANIGFKDGRLVVIDYSGYGLDKDWSDSHVDSILSSNN